MKSDLGRQNNGVQVLLDRDVGVGVSLQDRVSRMVPVGHPLPDRGPPVFEQELLRVLLAVAAPVTTLGSGLADLELTVEVDLNSIGHGHSLSQVYTHKKVTSILPPFQNISMV